MLRYGNRLLGLLILEIARYGSLLIDDVASRAVFIVTAAAEGSDR